MKTNGPAYDLGDGTVIQDLHEGCRGCGKRLCEVINDPAGVWHTGQIVCLDCGLTHRDDRCPARHPKHQCRCEFRQHGPEKQHMARHRQGVAVWDVAA